MEFSGGRGGGAGACRVWRSSGGAADPAWACSRWDPAWRGGGGTASAREDKGGGNTSWRWWRSQGLFSPIPPHRPPSSASCIILKPSSLGSSIQIRSTEKSAEASEEPQRSLQRQEAASFLALSVFNTSEGCCWDKREGPIQPSLNPFEPPPLSPSPCLCPDREERDLDPLAITLINQPHRKPSPTPVRRGRGRGASSQQGGAARTGSWVLFHPALQETPAEPRACRVPSLPALHPQRLGSRSALSPCSPIGRARVHESSGGEAQEPPLYPTTSDPDL